MSDVEETTDWFAMAAALVLLLTMFAFASQGNHAKDKAWNAMVDQVKPLIEGAP